ncbi:MAG: cysteine--tRNA ligase [Acidobacteria bacterium]|nr:cysteine--tRNA ligase [Acidobacteriota bacterium]
MALYNTLTREVERVDPILPGEVSLYTCGPTVYNYAHIGNLRTFLFQDLLKRTLQGLGYRVRHCMNITDVEDKIIRDSQQGLPPDADNPARHAAMEALTARYTAAFFEDLESVAIPREGFTFLPRATAYIPQMVSLIQRLEARGLAYAREGSVYFRIQGFPEYGRLARLDREGMLAGASVDADEYDRDSVQDFVLWKAARPGEPWWESPWGAGRPGWHIECSAMGLELLGERIDIHSGGVDLVFPHHENEIAQSEGCIGHPWVRCWVHGEFLLVEGQKMSKSLGNFFTLRDLVERGHDPLAFRYAILSNHYRKLLNFSMEGLRGAKAALDRIRAFRRRMEGNGESSGDGAWKEALDPLGRLAQARQAFWDALADDLNTPEALASLFTLVTDLNAQDDRLPLTREERDRVLAFLEEADGVFACWPADASVEDLEVAALVESRRAAKGARNWAEADRIREQLRARGIILEDRKDGSTAWHRA